MSCQLICDKGCQAECHGAHTPGWKQYNDLELAYADNKRLRELITSTALRLERGILTADEGAERLFNGVDGSL